MSFEGMDKNILLTSVFKPYAQDDTYGSRKNNPMELYHNQVTREQGVFSVRAFHPSFGLRLIQANLNVPCTVLEFPTLERFEEEITKNKYDLIGIGSITVNLFKVKKMCELIKIHQPKAEIIVGGTIANMKDLHKRIDADHIIQGDGLPWFMKRFGMIERIRHPILPVAFGVRVLGVNIPFKDDSAIIIPSLGCPMGCNFCMTSATFGGKGRQTVFYESADELFSIMQNIEKSIGAQSFFIMDENFLLNRNRALRLMELFEKNGKTYALSIFSSVNAIKRYSIDELLDLGVNFVWIGLEGEGSQYSKLGKDNTMDLVKKLKENGISTLGSSIIGLENHAPENISSIVEWGVLHNTDYHQFMLYTALPGTPLYKEYEKKNLLLDEKECPIHDTHGQYRFNYRHSHIKDQAETEMLTNAFIKDFEINGPSIVRFIETRLNGWEKAQKLDNPRVKKRMMNESRALAHGLAAAVWASRKWYRKDVRMYLKIDNILKEIYGEFGIKARAIAPLLGSFLYKSMRKEELQLNNGFRYEPETQYVKNQAAYNEKPDAVLAKWTVA